MIAIKTSLRRIPEYCGQCDYYLHVPHRIKGWTNICTTCLEYMDDDCKEGWHYDGDNRPDNCPLFEVVCHE